MSPLIILFIGIVVLGAGIFSFFWQRAKIAQSFKAEGVVTELVGIRAGQEFIVRRTEEGVNIEPKFLYRPQIRFRTESGRTIDFVARVASRPARYKIGERVSILYNPHQPAEARLNHFVEIWFVTLMLIFFGLFTIGMGWLSWALFRG